jgi:hypothetical protein
MASSAIWTATEVSSGVSTRRHLVARRQDRESSKRGDEKQPRNHEYRGWLRAAKETLSLPRQNSSTRAECSPTRSARGPVSPLVTTSPVIPAATPSASPVLPAGRGTPHVSPGSPLKSPLKSPFLSSRVLVTSKYDERVRNDGGSTTRLLSESRNAISGGESPSIANALEMTKKQLRDHLERVVEQELEVLLFCLL